MIPMTTNYEIEYYTKAYVRKLVKLFGSKFPTYFKDMKLTEDIYGYQIHNMGLPINFTLQDARHAIQFDVFACMITQAAIRKTKYPAMTGTGDGRVLIVIDKDFQDPEKLAFYRLDVPGKLSQAATDFDEQNAVEGFEGTETILVSTVPSRGRKARSSMPHRTNVRRPSLAMRVKYGRPSIQETINKESYNEQL